MKILKGLNMNFSVLYFIMEILGIISFAISAALLGIKKNRILRDIIAIEIP